MKLQSMTDFVLSQEPRGMEVQSLGWQQQDRTRRFYKILNYAKFLKQPLTLGMFVPCDEEGNVLEDIHKVKEKLNIWHPNHIVKYAGKEVTLAWYESEYNRAKDRVLFEGWYYISEWYGSHIIAKDAEGKSQICVGDYSTIESLMNDRYLTLTLTAIKQLGL